MGGFEEFKVDELHEQITSLRERLYEAIAEQRRLMGVLSRVRKVVDEDLGEDGTRRLLFRIIDERRG